MTIKKSALGKGLSALLENPETDITSRNDLSAGTALVGNVSAISVDKIDSNPFQPRTEFDSDALQELSESIKAQGVIQPVTVRKLGYDRYQLISGERRLKASKMAGLTHIPAYIRVANDRSMLEMALVENIQREDLNALEVAMSYKRLIDECDLTQEELSGRVGKNRTTVTNFMRLLKLPPEIQAAVRDNRISMGHARAILGISDVVKQLYVFREIINNDLSVRDVETMAREGGNKSPVNRKRTVAGGEMNLEFEKIKNVLSGHFGARIDLKRNASGRGKIMIPFENDSDLNRILELLNY
jgi:ParB family transcriptional regulator, chromosome partitioning protein